MQEHIVFKENAGFNWIDVYDPTREELEDIAAQYGLHRTSVQDCLQADHLPKVENISSIRFVIIRAFDEYSTPTCDSIQELTRKLALFIGDDFLITIHRKDQVFIKEIREKWREKVAQMHSREHIVNDLLRGSILSFEPSIHALQKSVNELEEQVFEGKATLVLHRGYYLRRRTAVVREVLKLSLDILQSWRNIPEQSAPFFQDLREQTEHLFFYASEALENVNMLLNLNISLASQRTNESSHRINEIMRLLTVFSAFFLPLNFIASIYGMNFEHMPELKFRLGYPGVLCVMGIVALVIFLWFRRRGWLAPPNMPNS